MNAKKIFQGKTKVVWNKKVAPGHYGMRLLAPMLAEVTKPGQFVQVQVADDLDPFLRRPFSLLSTSGDTMDILYAVVGKGTEILARKKSGDTVDVLGPLGNRWTPIPPKSKAKAKSILIGGGVGIPPLYFLAKEYVERRRSNPSGILVFLGARDRSLLLCQRDFKELGVEIHVATDDGSAGFRGYITELMREWLGKAGESYLYTCGPTPMLKAVAQVAQEFHLDGEVSMEAPMACGFGICVGCAIPVVGGGYKLCCYHGTVFKIREVAWEGMA